MDVEKIKNDFPILKRKISGKQVVYLDNGATSQKPVHVIEAMKRYYENHNANIHRSVHALAEEATKIYESARENVANFINAEKEEVIFTKNATEAINLVMYSWGLQLNKGDEIITTIMDHHSNIVPWQFLEKKGVKVSFIDITDDGMLKMDELGGKISSKTKLVAVTQASNVLGTINNVKEISKLAHDHGALCLVDGAQSVPKMHTDFKKINCDFLAFTGHKMLGPMGIGILAAKHEVLEKMNPFLYGGDMIKKVTVSGSTWNDLPWKFEAGTANVEGAVGLSAAVDYLKKIGMDSVRSHDKQITKYALQKLSEIDDVAIYGPSDPEKRTGAVSFNIIKNNNMLIHPHDLASLLNDKGIAIRSGNHCTQPLHDRLGVPSTSRASFYIYNTKEEVDILAEAINHAKKVFKLE
ncbi:MAG TPA: cysteine desulfurase [archaeon]|nr:cysteine desulfurase [archaeon]